MNMWSISVHPQNVETIIWTHTKINSGWIFRHSRIFKFSTQKKLKTKTKCFLCTKKAANCHLDGRNTEALQKNELNFQNIQQNYWKLHFLKSFQRIKAPMKEAQMKTLWSKNGLRKKPLIRTFIKEIQKKNIVRKKFENWAITFLLQFLASWPTYRLLILPFIELLGKTRRWQNR